MNDVTINGDRLVVEPRGLDKVWSFRRRIDVPLTHVVGATYDPGANDEPKGLRRPGLRVPSKASGTFVKDGERTYWNVSRPASTVVVELRDERLARLVLTVDEPRSLVSRINEVLG
jgi:hypothetical protein